VENYWKCFYPFIKTVELSDTSNTEIDLRKAVQSMIDTIDFCNDNYITDNLVVKIISVNGIDAETAGSTGYIRIASKN
jgi:hypothetical protein